MTTRQMRAAGLTVLLFVLTISMATAQRQPRTAAADPSVPVTALSDVRPDRVDLDAIYRIKDEGLQRSQVMDTAWYLTEVHGPRLTNSPDMRAAADWASKRLTEWGLSNVRQETWGPFGRGWVNERFTANGSRRSPRRSWRFRAHGHRDRTGPVGGDAVLVVIEREDDFKRGRASSPARSSSLAESAGRAGAVHAARPRRYTAQELADLEAQAVTPRPLQRTRPAAAPRRRRRRDPPSRSSPSAGCSSSRARGWWRCSSRAPAGAITVR